MLTSSALIFGIVFSSRWPLVSATACAVASAGMYAGVSGPLRQWEEGMYSMTPESVVGNTTTLIALILFHRCAGCKLARRNEQLALTSQGHA